MEVSLLKSYKIKKTDFVLDRPETEELVQVILDGGAITDSSRILEIGCGSGPISLSLLKARPDLKNKILAFDSTKNAVALTMENAIRNGLEDRIELKHARYVRER